MAHRHSKCSSFAKNTHTTVITILIPNKETLPFTLISKEMIKLYIENGPTLTFKMSYLLLTVSVNCQPLKYTKYDISIFCLPLVSLEMIIIL